MKTSTWLWIGAGAVTLWLLTRKKAEASAGVKGFGQFGQGCPSGFMLDTLYGQGCISDATARQQKQSLRMVRAQCALSGGTMSAGQCTLPGGQVISALGSAGGALVTPPITYSGQYQQILSGPVTAQCPNGTDQYGNCMSQTVLPYGTPAAAATTVYGTQPQASAAPASSVQSDNNPSDISLYM
jgi:hypothetical protein